MKVLILTQWYPPEPVLLLQELAQSFQDDGHEVTVLTGLPNYPSGRLYPGYRLRLWQRETIAGIPVVRVFLYPDHSRSRFVRFLNYLSFALSSGILGRFLAKRPDVVFVYHPPLTVGLPAVLLSRLWGVPFVLQIQDMWPETLRATGMLDNEQVLRWTGAFASWMYRRAAAICVVSPGFRANLVGKGVPAEKIRTISNWVDTALYRPVEPDAGLAAALGLAGRFNVMFAGNIGEAQGLDTVLDAAGMLRDIAPLQFAIVGDGLALPNLREAAARRKLSNVLFLGPYPPEEMTRLYALADLLLVHLKDDPLFRITVPHKIFAYMASGKPILAAVAGDAAAVVAEAGAGLVCPPEDPASLAATARRLYGMPARERERFSRCGLQAARSTYSRSRLVREIEAILACKASC